MKYIDNDMKKGIEYDYKKIAKNYTIEEVESFFMYNSKYNSLHNTEEE